MRVLRVCLFLLVAAIAHPSHLRAAARYVPRHPVVTPVAFHRTSAVILPHLSFPHHYPHMLNLPAQPLQASINPPSSSHGFSSLVSYAIHSVLGLFRHSPA